MKYRCGCGATWGGANTSHCSGCHLTFSSVSTFDKHRRDFACLSPESVGLEPNHHGYYGTRGTGEWWGAA